MPVHIKKIHVQNLGPISQFTMKPGVLNLIYGRNEQGKTHLVEFIIRSLFRNVKPWTLRSQKGNGKVHVAGLGEKEVEFFPESRIKIDNYLEESIPGLPPDFSRLLVVKGAEVGLSFTGTKTDKTIVKKYLSSQELLDRIDDKISQTIKDAQLQKGAITAKKMGEGKNRSELEENLNTLDQLFQQIDKGYSGGKRKRLNDDMAHLRSRLSQMERAKWYSAYMQNQQKEKLQADKNKIDEGILQKIKDYESSYRHKIDEMKRRNEMLGKSRERGTHYTWLKQAVDEYSSLINRKNKSPRLILLFLGLISLAAGAIFTLVNIPIAVFASLGTAVLFVIIHILILPRLTRDAIYSEEMDRLREAFRKRFGTELTDLSALNEKLKSQEADYNKAQVLQEQLEKDESDVEDFKSRLSDEIYSLFNQRVKPQQWREIIQKVEKKITDLKNNIQKQEVELAKLGVDPSDFITEDPGVTYSKQAYEAIQQKMERLQNEIHEENKKLEILKDRIVRETGDTITSPWETLLESLRKKRNEVLDAYKNLTAEIIGKKIVHEVLVLLRKGEDEKIVTGLQSKTVLAHLSRFTGERYHSIDLDGEDLIISGKTNNFRLSDLSTGAQEQTLLALRIGFASKLFNQNLFLILDDAFQYSDWQRRQWLIDAMTVLAQNDWQILYFTMDDHIRGLFEKKSKDCQVIELPH